MATFDSLWKGKNYLMQSTMLYRDPFTVGTLILSGLGVAGASAFVATTIGYIATTLVTSWLLSALAPSTDTSGSQGTSLTNSVQAAANGEIVYGRVRKGGIITYMEATGSNNQYLHMIIAYACHTIEAFESIYIDDTIVTMDGSGFVTSGSWNSKIRIKTHLGSVSQAADATLLAESAQITAAFQGKGIAYLYIRLEYNEDVFVNGIPTFTAVIKGKKLYDNRTLVTVWSQNAALAVRDYLISQYGPEVVGGDINDTAFNHAADVCDVSITPSGGSAQAMFTIDAVFNTGQTYRDVLQSMMVACGGSLYHSMGQYKLIAAEYVAPVKTLTLDNVRSEINIDTKVPRHDNFNSITGTFVDASQDYIVTDYPKIIDTNFLAEDGGVDNPIDMPMVCITNTDRAIRVGTIALRRAREQLTVSTTFDMNALDLDVGDFVFLTMSRYGWSSKVFQINSWSLGVDGEGALVIEMTLRESSSAAFSTTLSTRTIVKNNTTLPNYGAPPPPTALVTADGGNLSSEGYYVPIIAVSWTNSTDNFVSTYRIKWKENAASTFYVQDVKTNKFQITGVKDATTYNIEVYSVNIYGVVSATALSANFTTQFAVAPPASLTLTNATNVGADGYVIPRIACSWPAASGTGLIGYRLSYRKNSVSAWTAVDLGLVTSYNIPGNSGFLNATLYDVQVQTLNSSGAVSSPRSNTITTSYVVTAITTLAATNTVNVSADGYVIPVVALTWTAFTNTLVSLYKVQWKENAGSSWKGVTLDNLMNNYDVPGLINGTLYNFRIQVQNVNGELSAWQTINFTATHDTTAPSVPTSLAAIGIIDGIRLTWVNSAAKDLHHVDVYENTVNNSATATKIAEVKDITWTRTNLGASILRYYWLKSVDNSGNISAFTAVANATSRFILTTDVGEGQITTPYGVIASPKLINGTTLTKINTIKVNRAAGSPTRFSFQIQVIAFDESSDMTVVLKTGSRTFYQNKMGILQNQQNLVAGECIDNDLAGGSTIYDLFVSRPQASLTPKTFIYQNVLNAYQLKR